MHRGQSNNYRGGRGGRNAGQRSQPRGLFADGVWHCDCTPRLPAEHFKVKKEGKNHGRWFYTCQQQEPKRCGFFLWDEDATPRMESAVLNGKRSEPGVQAGWNAGRDRDGGLPPAPNGKALFQSREQPASGTGDDSTDSEQPPPYSTQMPRSNGAKRDAQDANLDDEGYDDWALNADEARYFGREADGGAPATPFKAQKTGVYATPATSVKRKLPWMEQPADATHNTPPDDYFASPSKQSAKVSQTLSSGTDPVTPMDHPTIATASTPSPPTRHKDALVNPADDFSSLTAEVLASLSSARIPAETISSVRSILTKHDLRTQGIRKGRDISRLALRAKDAKIAELQARIASLEADMELERGLGRLNRRAGGEG